MYVLYYYEEVMCLTTLVYMYMCAMLIHYGVYYMRIIIFFYYLNLEQAYEGNKMMQSPYLVDRDVLYIGYDSVIGTSKADMNLSDLMVVKAKVPLN